MLMKNTDLRPGIRWLSVGGFSIAWILFSFVFYHIIVIPNQQRFDFYARWVGAREVLKRESPYTERVTLSIQQGMFGHSLGPNEDQNRFAYVPFITWLLLPFWILPFPIAISMWCGLQFILLFLTPFLVISALHWKIDFFALIGILLLSTVIFRHPINAFLIGQFTPFVLFCIALALFGIVNGYEKLSGIALLWAMVRPEITILLVLTLLMIAYQNKYLKMIWIWIGGMISLWIITRIFIGVWEPEFIKGLGAYSDYALLVWPPGLVGSRFLQIITSVAVLVWAFWMLNSINPIRHPSQPVWMLSVAAIFYLIIIPQTGYYNLMLGLLPVWLMFWVMSDHILGWIPVTVVLLFPWLFHVILKTPVFEFLFVPLGLLILLSIYWLYWTGRKLPLLGGLPVSQRR